MGKIYKKEEELGFHNHTFYGFYSLTGNSTVMLYNCLLHNLREKRDYQGFEKAKAEFNKRFGVLGRSKRKPLKLSPYWFWKWSLKVYLKTFPLAFLLYLVWINGNRREWRDCQREEKTRRQRILLRNPISFVLMLIFYPVIISYFIIRDFRDAGRIIIAEAELRRTKERLFCLLSNDEIAAIQKFLENNLPFSWWRKYLFGQGLFYKHSLMAALLATVIIMFVGLFIPKSSPANERYSPKKNIFVNCSVQVISNNIIKDNINKNKIPDHQDFKDFIHELFDFYQTLRVCLFKRFEIVFRIKGFFSRIDHVPIAAVQSSYYNFN